MGFHFIDQITAINADRASGRLRRPAGVPPLPPWLVIEAVGQLAGWIAVLRSDFARRPVAALVGEIGVGERDADGDIELQAHIERQDARAILYAGSATCGGRTIVTLARCVGPLLPMEGFDDPDTVRARLASLRAGTVPGEPAVDADVVVHPQLGPIALGDGVASSHLQVPAAAPFFADHFPLRPVYPASLLADALSQLGAPVAAQALDVDADRMRVARLSDYKVRAFSPPGQLLELEAELRDASGARPTIQVHASADGKRIARGVLEYHVLPPA